MRMTGVGRGGRCALGVTRRMELGLGVEAVAEQWQHSREGYLASFWQAGRWWESGRRAEEPWQC